MSQYSIIFDFDGTLVDTRLGIVRSMQFALSKMGLPDLPVENIEKLIGKPLEKMFEIIIGEETSSERIQEGVALFRSRYKTEGLMECDLYEDTVPILKWLSNQNIDLYILTSKPTQFAQAICSSFNILRFFKDINGVDMDRKSPDKSNRLGQMIEQYQLDKKETLLVGDRADDCLAARNNGILMMGALYGYGSYKELYSNGCKHMCNSLKDLVNWLEINKWENI